jgi:hypothetical protein
MKSISSAIVVLAGIYGTNASISQLEMKVPPYPFLGLMAGILTLGLGLIGWWVSLKYDR